MHNDIWSLGVILVNLTCGRNPWRQACPSDETFRAYLDNPDFLRSILPISLPCNDLLKRIFSLNPMARISLAELRDAVIKMPRWTMTEAELSRATRETREAARAFVKAVDNLPHSRNASRQSSITESVAYPASVASSSDASSTAYSFASSVSFPGWSSSNAPQPATTRPTAFQNQRQCSSRPLPPLPSSVRSICRSQSADASKRSVLGSPVKLTACPSATPPRIEALTIDVSAHMDLDVPLFSPATAITPPTPRLDYPSTPKAQTRPRMSSRSPPSSSSSSSSDDSWSDQPRTPNTPVFGNLSVASQVDIQKGDSVNSTVSSHASFENYYGQYASWASTDDDEDAVMSTTASVHRAAQAYQHGIAQQQQHLKAQAQPRLDPNLLTAAALAAANQAYVAAGQNRSARQPPPAPSVRV